jgi:predicted ATP-grasp superfamily ATP-dependent carboligase
MTIIVLDGNENQAVAATRSLARAGHRVIVGAESRWSKAGWSRACHSSFQYPQPAEDVAAFVERLAVIVGDLKDVYVMPMTERTLLPLSEHRARIAAAGGRMTLPEHYRVLQACSKVATGQLATSLNIQVPRTFTLGQDALDARRVSTEVAYPVVLKPAMSYEHGRTMRATGAPEYASHASEFLDAWRRISTRCQSVLVQSFVVGGGTGYFALVRHGEVVAEFAHRRIRDVRPTGSGSAVRESIAVGSRLRDPSQRLLRALQWHGVAMVEYRERPNGELVFLEVNGRFWNSLPLAIAAGVDFPRLLVDMETAGQRIQQPAYRPGVRCRWWLGDTRHLLQVMQGPPRGYPVPFPRRLSTLLAYLTPHRGTVHDNFRWSDPAPELGDWLHLAMHKVPQLWRRRTVSGVGDVEGRAAHS